MKEDIEVLVELVDKLIAHNEAYINSGFFELNLAMLKDGLNRLETLPDESLISEK